MPEISDIFITYMCREALLTYLQVHSPKTHEEKLFALVFKKECDGAVLFRQRLYFLLREFSVLYVNDESHRFSAQLLTEIGQICRLLGRKHVNLMSITHDCFEGKGLFVPDKQYDVILGICDNAFLLKRLPNCIKFQGAAILLTPSNIAREPKAVLVRNEQKNEKRIRRHVNFNGYVVLGTVANFTITNYVVRSEGCQFLLLTKNLLTQSDFDGFVGRSVTNICLTAYSNKASMNKWCIANIIHRQILEKLFRNKNILEPYAQISALPIPDSYILSQEGENDIKFVSKHRLVQNGIIRVKPRSYFVSSKNSLLPVTILAAIYSSRLFIWYYQLYRQYVEEGQDREVWKNAMKSLPAPGRSTLHGKRVLIRRLVEVIEWMESMPFDVHSEFPLPSHIYKIQEILDMVVYEIYFPAEMREKNLLVTSYLEMFVNQRVQQRIDLFAYELTKWYEEFGNPVRDRIALLSIRSSNLLNIIHSIK